MTADIKCPYCRTEYTIDHSELGHAVSCEVCGKQFVATGSTKIQDVPPVRANTTRNNVRVARGTIDQKPKGLSGETWLKRKTRLAIIGACLEIASCFITLGNRCCYNVMVDYYGLRWPSICLEVLFYLLFLAGWILITLFFYALYKRQ